MNVIIEIIQRIKSLFKKNNYTEWEWNRGFSISVGEICEVCFEELDLYQGGYRGEPTKCKSCQIEYNRDIKLQELDI